MKKTILSALFIMSVLCVKAQSKEPVKQPAAQADTIAVITFKELTEYAKMIDRAVDSKEATRALTMFLEQRIQIIPKQVADKPKEAKKP